jgi:hypothetical protein
MIAAWQTAHGLPATGFLDASQRQRLLGDSAAAVATFDAEQKKAADEDARSPAGNRLGRASPSAFAGRWSLVRSK